MDLPRRTDLKGWTDQVLTPAAFWNRTHDLRFAPRSRDWVGGLSVRVRTRRNSLAGRAICNHTLTADQATPSWLESVPPASSGSARGGADVVGDGGDGLFGVEGLGAGVDGDGGLDKLYPRFITASASGSVRSTRGSPAFTEPVGGCRCGHAAEPECGRCRLPAPWILRRDGQWSGYP